MQAPNQPEFPDSSIGSPGNDGLADQREASPISPEDPPKPLGDEGGSEPAAGGSEPAAGGSEPAAGGLTARASGRDNRIFPDSSIGRASGC